MKKFIYLWIVLLLCVACKKNQVRLSGKFENASKRYLLLSKIEPDDVVFLDTISLLSGKFSHSITEAEIGIYLLKYDDTTFLSFIAQSGDQLVFSGDAQHLKRTYDIQGNEESRLLQETDRKLSLFYDKTKQWAIIFLQHKYKDDYEETIAYLDSLYDKEFELHKEYLTQFITQHAGKLATLPAFYQKAGNIAFFDPQKDRDLLQEIYTALSKTYPNSIYVEDLKEKLED